MGMINVGVLYTYLHVQPVLGEEGEEGGLDQALEDFHAVFWYIVRCGLRGWLMAGWIDTCVDACIRLRSTYAYGTDTYRYHGPQPLPDAEARRRDGRRGGEGLDGDLLVVCVMISSVHVDGLGDGVGRPMCNAIHTHLPAQPSYRPRRPPRARWCRRTGLGSRGRGRGGACWICVGWFGIWGGCWKMVMWGAMIDGSFEIQCHSIYQRSPLKPKWPSVVVW